MAKKLVQDILVGNKKDKGRRENLHKRPVTNTFSNKNIIEFSSLSTNLNKRMYNKKPIYLSLAAILVLVLVFLVSSWALASVDLKVTTTKRNVDIDDVFLATIQTPESSNILKFEQMKVNGKESVQLLLTETKQIDKKAFGNVTIYNELIATPQKLIAKTRLETTDGKVYRLTKPVTIPGAISKNGKIIPGQASVDVEADQVGKEYNIVQDIVLKVLAFKGTTKYSKIYAKSKTAIAGGISGQIKTISDDTLGKSVADLKQKLSDSLEKKSLTQIPPGYLLYQDAAFVDFQDNKDELYTASGDSFNLIVSGELLALIIKTDELENFIATKKITDFNGADVTISSLPKFSFSLIGKRIIDPNNISNFSFRLTGTSTIVWNYDENLLKTKLLGIKKYDHQKVFKEFPMIEKAEATLRPFWLRSFPSDINRIKIERTNE